MLRRIWAAAALLSLATMTAPVTQVLACSCIQLGPGDALSNADVAWVGVVTKVGNAQDDPVHYTFAVEQSLKGKLTATLDVFSSPSSASCGQPFALAQRWKVFAFADDKGQLQTGLCSRDELLAEGVTPTPAPGAGPPVGLLVAGGALLVIGAVSAWAFTRRQRREAAQG